MEISLPPIFREILQKERACLRPMLISVWFTRPHRLHCAINCPYISSEPAQLREEYRRHSQWRHTGKMIFCLLNYQASDTGSGSGSRASKKRKLSPSRSTGSGRSGLTQKQKESVDDVITTLLGSSRVDESNFVKLSPAGWAVAREVFHPPQQ